MNLIEGESQDRMRDAVDEGDSQSGRRRSGELKLSLLKGGDREKEIVIDVGQMQANYIKEQSCAFTFSLGSSDKPKERYLIDWPPTTT